MNTLNANDAAPLEARGWSGRLGSLAAGLPASTADTIARGALPTRLAILLHQLGRRSVAREHAADKLRAQEFMMGP